MIEVGCGVIELSVIGNILVYHMWSFFVDQMCFLLDELGQVRRVGWLLENLIRLTQVYDWFGKSTHDICLICWIDLRGVKNPFVSKCLWD